MNGSTELLMHGRRAVRRLAGQRGRALRLLSADFGHKARPAVETTMGADDQLTACRDRLGRAGFLSGDERHRAAVCCVCLVAVSTAAPMAFYFGRNWGRALPLLGAAGFLSGLGAVLAILRVRIARAERTLLFELPIFLESMILLAEAGCGLLPALEQVVAACEIRRRSLLFRTMALALRLSASGIPFPQALEMVAANVPQRVLRHVLLHLDLSATEGAELIPSLRSLSDHTHTEWRLSVEHRVRRLENWVVFPVFGAVLGLMLLVAAVPLVPMLHLHDHLQLSGVPPGSGVPEAPMAGFTRDAEDQR